jgi:pyruvate kinase
MPEDNALFHLPRTKIVATIGPACRGVEKLTILIQEGVAVFRINTAHGSREERDAMFEEIREAEKAAGRPVGILVDLAGPKIRLGELFTDPLVCHVGEKFRFVLKPKPEAPDELTCVYEPLVDELEIGNLVMLADGTVSMRVVARGNKEVTCEVVGGGTLRSRQGINLPGAKLKAPALTEADLANVVWASQKGADIVSLSFVRSPEEVRQLKILLRGNGSSAIAMAKIEKGEALERLEEIVEEADGIMVARGDLGVETDVAEIAVAQKRIVHACQHRRRPVIVATQMLDSMHHNRRPTRAEATDVANAILDGADACMLSGETAIGEFPVEAVKTMNRISLATEKFLRDMRRPIEDGPAPDVHPITAAAITGCGQIARQLEARLVVIATRSGATARLRSKQRDFTFTIGVSDKPDVLRKMSLYWGVLPLAGAPVHDGPQLRAFIEQWGRNQGILNKGDRVVFATGTNFYPMAHNLLVIHEVE